MKTNKHYVSEIDKELAKFDQTHPKSASQQAEIDKHERVNRLRDNSTLPEANDDDFFD